MPEGLITTITLVEPWPLTKILPTPYSLISIPSRMKNQEKNRILVKSAKIYKVQTPQKYISYLLIIQKSNSKKQIKFCKIFAKNNLNTKICTRAPTQELLF